jgi:hypothetical protein
MTARMTAGLVAGALAVGMLVGAAGTVLVHDATRPGWHQMGGPGMPMMGRSMMAGTDWDEMVELHEQHHGLSR